MKLRYSFKTLIAVTTILVVLAAWVRTALVQRDLIRRLHRLGCVIHFGHSKLPSDNDSREHYYASPSSISLYRNTEDLDTVFKIIKQLDAYKIACASRLNPIVVQISRG